MWKPTDKETSRIEVFPFSNNSTSELDLNSLGRLGYEGAKYEMYMDDGINPAVTSSRKPLNAEFKGSFYAYFRVTSG